MLVRYQLLAALMAALLLHGLIFIPKYWMSLEANAEEPSKAYGFTSRLIFPEQQTNLALDVFTAAPRAANGITQKKNSASVGESLSGRINLDSSMIELDLVPAEPIRYWENSEVDVAAQPVGEWEINPNTLPLASVTVVELKLWISANGVIEAWELLGERANQRAVLDCLQPISGTAVNPAKRHGQPVASVKLIELRIERVAEDVGN